MTNEDITLLAAHVLTTFTGAEEEACGIGSALVNLVDTARERPELFEHLTQEGREASIAAFLRGHSSTNLPQVCGDGDARDVAAVVLDHKEDEDENDVDADTEIHSFYQSEGWRD